ncbi:hypothetical protein [Paenibacillus elgii]|uniref:hypothetical protein n=1 Tax=Paenibacillus elgii TaxID=189691 RepID=UPI001300C6EC|nr:hypothetical protein [Paenibacillus elgii]
MKKKILFETLYPSERDCRSTALEIEVVFNCTLRLQLHFKGGRKLSTAIPSFGYSFA